MEYERWLSDYEKNSVGIPENLSPWPVNVTLHDLSSPAMSSPSPCSSLAGREKLGPLVRLLLPSPTPEEKSFPCILAERKPILLLNSSNVHLLFKNYIIKTTHDQLGWSFDKTRDKEETLGIQKILSLWKSILQVCDLKSKEGTAKMAHFLFHFAFLS